jgi:phosphoglycolate phosphatase-like HAD superfamily hydrolase
MKKLIVFDVNETLLDLRAAGFRLSTLTNSPLISWGVTWWRWRTRSSWWMVDGH